MNKFDKARVSVNKIYEQLMYFNEGKMIKQRKHAKYYKSVISRVIDLAEKQERLLYLYKELTQFSRTDLNHFNLKRDILKLEKSLLPSKSIETRLTEARYKLVNKKPYIKEYTKVSMGSLNKVVNTISISEKRKLVRVSTTKFTEQSDIGILEPFKINLELVNLLKHILDKLYVEKLEEDYEDE